MYYDQIDVSEGINVNNTAVSKKVYCLSLLVLFRWRI